MPQMSLPRMVNVCVKVFVTLGRTATWELVPVHDPKRESVPAATLALSVPTGKLATGTLAVPSRGDTPLVAPTSVFGTYAVRVAVRSPVVT